MKATHILVDALKYPPATRGEYTDEAILKFWELSEIFFPGYGKVDPLLEKYWADSTGNSIISFFIRNPKVEIENDFTGS